ncbi:MAG: hypothetical protein WKF84_28940 [Pyrinomonadaceae bacterium]
MVRAAIEAVEAFWFVSPDARIVQVDPLVNVISGSPDPETQVIAEHYRLAQFEAWDMLAGHLRPELGGHTRYLDIVGVNYYPHNQRLSAKSRNGFAL